MCLHNGNALPIGGLSEYLDYYYFFAFGTSFQKAIEMCVSVGLRQPIERQQHRDQIVNYLIYIDDNVHDQMNNIGETNGIKALNCD